MMLSRPLTTARLALRPIEPGDNTYIRGLVSDMAVRRFLGGPVPEEQIGEYLAALYDEALEAPHWTVFYATIPVGLISLTPHKDGADIELSYQFSPDVWGRGFAIEATQAVLDAGLQSRQCNRIIAETQTANTASMALLTRLGLVEIEHLRRFGAEQAIFATQP